MKPFILKLFFLLSLATVASAQSDFRAFMSSEDLIEGGRVDKITVLSSNFQFSVRPPKEWSRQVQEANHRIVFTSPTHESAITVYFTGVAPNELPSAEDLRDQTLRAHPGAGISVSAPCATSLRPGIYFDLARTPAPNVLQRIRHAYVAGPTGVVEFVLTSSGEEFEKNKGFFMGAVRAFRVEPLRTKPS